MVELVTLLEIANLLRVAPHLTTDEGQLPHGDGMPTPGDVVALRQPVAFFVQLAAALQVVQRDREIAFAAVLDVAHHGVAGDRVGIARQDSLGDLARSDETVRLKRLPGRRHQVVATEARQHAVGDDRFERSGEGIVDVLGGKLGGERRGDRQ